MPYFKDLKADSVTTEKIENFLPLTIQPGDLLAINVNSLNHEADAIINYNLARPSGTNVVAPNTSEEVPTSSGESQNAVYGYLVDRDGNLHLPMVGIIKVSGLTTEETTRLIEIDLQQYLSQPVVNVRLENFRVSVLGDVSRPGFYTVPNESISLLQALSVAGDLNTTGVRQNVILIREIDGKREYVHFDLRSKKIFRSPYFYLKNNDVIYVQPNGDKVSSGGSGFEKFSLLLSALSIVAIFITSTKK